MSGKEIQERSDRINKMKLKNILIVVKDIERSRQFYHDLFGLDRIVAMMEI